jgi:hypothetical protein
MATKNKKRECTYCKSKGVLPATDTHSITMPCPVCWGEVEDSEANGENGEEKN